MNDYEHEEWRDIPGYEGRYQISDAGRVKSFWRGRERIMLRGLHGDGYWTVTLSKDRAMKTFKVHSLVARAFIGECPEGYEVNHKDLNKQNAAVSNLEYLTHLDNIRHAVIAGAYRRGAQHSSAKLTDDDVRRIHEMGAQGVNNLEIAKSFGVTRTAIRGVLDGSRWRHLHPDPMRRESQQGRRLTPSNATMRRREKAERFVKRIIRDTRVMLAHYDGLTQSEIAAQFGICQQSVCLIIKAQRPQMEGQR